MSISVDAYHLTMTEAEWQSLIVETAQTCNWLVVHVRQMIGNPEGLPDLLMWRDNRYLLVELKTERGRVRPSQQRWHHEALRYGVEVHVWRPSDFDAVVALLRPDPA